MDLKGKFINGRYEVVSKIGEGGMSTVWRAIDVCNKANVAIKVLKKYATSSMVENIIRFKNEASTVTKLSDANIVKVIEVGEIDNTHYIAMEYIEGRSLQAHINDGIFAGNIDITVEIIYQMCKALKCIHNLNVVHRDLKPGNILIDDGGIQNCSGSKVNIVAKIIDFGLSQVKDLKMNDTREIVGTLTYMSPEQSGIIKRNVDERSDLYSLGVIFYQLLTGRSPFKGDNINSILHQQIAKIPDSPEKHNKQVPYIVSQIVLKLLEKEPERRYQSAEGLLRDLERYKEGTLNFIPGLDDRWVKLDYRTDLIGRKEDINKLKSLYDDSTNGNGRICVIKGESGLGKTRLLEELKNYVYEKDGVYLDCKCFSGKNKIPYGPFKDALNIYIKNFNGYEESQKKSIKDFLKLVIGDLGDAVIKLNPVMEEIIGKYLCNSDEDSDRDNKRFLMIVTQLLYGLGHIENSIVIAIDDIQWIDEPSLELLNDLMKEIARHPVLIICTYRPSGISINNSINKLMESTGNNDLTLCKILLSLFNYNEMTQLISGILFNDIEDMEEITNFTFKKSKGNPFFSIEILKQLVNEKAITRIDGTWQIDRDIMKGVDVPATIVDVLIKKISFLNEKEIEVLSYAAVIGTKFDIRILFTLSSLPKEEVVEVIDNAIKLQLIEKVSYREGELVFSHNRIRETFYCSVDRNEKIQLHLKIAMEIEEIGVVEENIFDLVYHYVESKDTAKILQYAYIAALKYKANYSNEEALNLFLLETKLLEEAGQRGTWKWASRMEEIGDTYLIIGRYDEAIEVFSRIIPFIASNLKKANAYRHISKAYFKKGDWNSCERYAKLGLKLLKERLPIKTTKINFSILKERITKIFYALIPNIILEKKSEEKIKKCKEKVDLYHILSLMYVFNDVRMCTYTTLRMLNLCQCGSKMLKECSLSMGVYASFTLARRALFKRAAKYHEITISYKQALADEWGIANSLQLIGVCCEWSGEYVESTDSYKQSIEKFRRFGDVGEIAISKRGLSFVQYYIGDYNNAKIINDEYYDISNKSKDIYGVLNCWEMVTQIAIEEGQFEKAEQYGMKSYNLSTEIESLIDKCIASGLLGVIDLEKQNYKKAIQHLEEALAIYETHDFIKQYTVFIYYKLADSYIYQYVENKGRMNRKQSRLFLRKIKELCEMALYETKNWVTHYMCAVRSTAKYYELIEYNQNAEEYFIKSISLAKETGRKFELGKCFYEYALFLKRREKPDWSRNNMELAYNVFKEIGAAEYENRSAEHLGIIRQDISYSKNFIKELKYNQRLSTIMSLIQDISAILDLDQLLDKIITVVIQVIGAQKGYLLVKEDRIDQIKVIAKKSIDEEDLEPDDFSKNIVEKVFENGEPILTTNAMEDEKYHSYRSVLYNELKSVLCIPMKNGNKIKGVCYLSNPLSSGVFTEEDLDILETIMIQASISIQNARLYKLAITDGLTDLITHRQFKFILRKEVERAKRLNEIFSLIMFDIDHFKKINDTYGHQAGDEVLVSLSRVTREQFRGLDIVARYGGEEFSVILPGTDVYGARTVAERFRKAIENMTTYYKGRGVKITVSLGIAVYPHHASTEEELVRAADEALYQCKQEGRNRTIVAKFEEEACEDGAVAEFQQGCISDLVV